ncbi:unnamed protein product, partial [Amoebophrya sp. A25]|eukprot:GSA25T00022877001.1
MEVESMEISPSKLKFEEEEVGASKTEASIRAKIGGMILKKLDVSSKTCEVDWVLDL